MTAAEPEAPGPSDPGPEDPPEEAGAQAPASDGSEPDAGAASCSLGDGASADTALAEARTQRDEYLDDLQRLKAEFDNYRKRIRREHEELREQAGQRVVERLLGALDALDLASIHHPEVVEPLYAALRTPLIAEGLERLEPGGSPFDPTEHEAVSHEPGDEGEKAVVVEVLRPGYRWKGRLLRPALVKVRG